MTIDPARLARIRSRLLAAAAVTALGSAGCGGPEQVNTRAPDPVDTGHTPINERAPDAIPTAPPDETPPPAEADSPNVNRPAPEPKNINTPPPDRFLPPDATRTINTPADQPPPAPPASSSAAPASPAKKPPPDHVNRPKPDP